MDEKKYSSFFKEYYIEHKALIDVLGFIGVVATLFLQITQFEGDALKMIQALLLVVFTLLLSYLLIDCLIKLIAYKKETPKSIAINSTIFSVTIGLFIFNLFRFLYTSFNSQLLTIYSWTKFGLVLLMCAYFNDLVRFLTSRYGNERLWLVVNEFFYGVVWYFLFVYPTYHFQLKWLLYVCALVFIGVLLAFRWISLKVHNFLLLIIAAGFIMALYLPTLVNSLEKHLQ